MSRYCRLPQAITIALLAGLAVRATASPVQLSYADAQLRFERASGALGAAAADVSASELDAASVNTLGRPVVGVSAQVIEYQKTLGLDLTGTREAAGNAINNFLGSLPDQFPPEFGSIVAQVTDKISAALPGTLGVIPDTLRYQTRETVFRPTVTAAVPLYTGGAIPAAKAGARAGVDAARAKAGTTRNLSDVRLAAAYFGVQLADQLSVTAQTALTGLNQYLHDARAMEREGVLAHANVLMVEVARDAAARAVDRSARDQQIAMQTLAQLVDVAGGVAVTTPLFVNRGALLPMQTYVAAALGDNPMILGAAAAQKLAGAGSAMARSRQLPQAYAFAEYSFNPTNAIPIDPDWIVGVGVRYTLLSGSDRAKALAAARMRERAASEATREARTTVEIETSRSYAIVDNARRAYLLLDTNIAAAQENLRVQQIAFREGESTITALLDARTSLSLAQSQRAAAAFEYDLALVALLAASNRSHEFASYFEAADRMIVP
ncbi:TolC family protein [Polymorphobacter arshaanensis]|uniref:TolC family protein n=1 Tax=Glacieibacterium arshaanense TaxID=2511025 RepID=A0A4Y9ERN7_9SPHN|nr:TolC family protein [Polymorphobacter arshaanensis]TFU05863.1 TolC family protein [Polymorphobacter arshaanensis]